MLLYFLYTIHVLTCIFLILVVLLQRGKGADLSVFGGGATQAAFGARSTATLLHKLTVGFFVAFIVTTLSIAMVQSRTQGTTVLAGADDEAAVEEPVEAEDRAGTAEGAREDADVFPAAGDPGPATETGAEAESQPATMEASADGSAKGTGEEP